MVFIQVLCMMAHTHSIFVLLMFKKYNKSSLNPAWIPALWFPHSHQFCSENQALWKWNSPLLPSFLVLHFFLWIFSWFCLSLRIYAFISGCWAMGCGPTPASRKWVRRVLSIWSSPCCVTFHIFFVILISMVPSILMKFITRQEGSLRLSCFLVY